QSFTFDVTTTGYGGSNYACPAGSGIVLMPSFMADCVTNDPSGLAQPMLQIASYHGTDTYTFTGSSAGGASPLPFGPAHYDFITRDVTPGEQPPTCTAKLVGPPTLSQGDHVTGTFHCDAVRGLVVHGDPSTYYPPVTTSVDGHFDGYVVF